MVGVPDDVQDFLPGTSVATCLKIWFGYADSLGKQVGRSLARPIELEPDAGNNTTGAVRLVRRSIAQSQGRDRR
jgi:hypothetical protein